MMSSATLHGTFRIPMPWIVLVMASAFLLAVTAQSFWIDEACTVWFAGQSTLAKCWSEMERLRFPEVQLPFYMLYLWSYIKVFGSGEWVLRMAGFPWLVGGAALFVVAVGRAIGSRMLAALLVAWSPFAWFYLNEARVYSIQLGLALAVVGAGVAVLQSMEAQRPAQGWLRALLLSLWLLCGTSVLGAMWGFFFFFGFLLAVPRAQWTPLLRLIPGSVTACIIGLAALAGYYAWTMTLHAKPTPGVTSVQTVAFVWYEILGAAGLGPGRNQLREAGVGALKPFLAPLLLFAMLVAVVLGQGVKELAARYGRRCLVPVLVGGVTPFALLLVLGVVTQLRVLGRHATPLLALLLIVLAFGLVRLARGRGWAGRGLAGSFLLLCLASCLSLRFAARHEKDDYRSAATVAKSVLTAGKSVWWSADESGAVYYGLALEKGLAGSGSCRLLANRSDEELRALKEPGVIILSKPDLYDNTGALGRYVHGRGYRVAGQFPAFVIWTKDR